MSDEPEQAPAAPEQAPERKRKKEKRKLPAEALKPRPSLWPFALAVALMIALVGFITYPALLIAGLILTATCVIGWGVERWGVESQ